jgi:hypothetical protein
MAHKRKAKTKKPLQPTVLTPEEENSVISILEKCENTDPAEIVSKVPDQHLALALIERVCASEAPSVPLLVALKDGFSGKQVRKAVKRALFKLKQKGIPVEEFSKPDSPPPLIIPSPQEEAPSAFVGPVLNIFGSRAVFITHHITTKGMHLATGLASDEEGIHDFRYGPFSKKRTKEMKDVISGKAGPLVETSLSHAATILEHAYQRHVEKHPEIPSHYLALRPWLLNNSMILDRPAIYDLVTEGQVVHTPMTDSQLETLFQHKLMETWLIDFERLRPFVEETLKAEDSPIVLSSGQKSDQAKRIREKCMDELFGDAERALLKGRLEEMAFVFLKLEEEDFFQLCLNAARITGQEAALIQKNPFIELLVARSFDYYLNLIRAGAPEDPEPTDKSSSGIILA